MTKTVAIQLRKFLSALCLTSPLLVSLFSNEKKEIKTNSHQLQSMPASNSHKFRKTFIALEKSFKLRVLCKKTFIPVFLDVHKREAKFFKVARMVQKKRADGCRRV
jgi:hypothetical protein